MGLRPWPETLEGSGFGLDNLPLGRVADGHATRVGDWVLPFDRLPEDLGLLASAFEAALVGGGDAVRAWGRLRGALRLALEARPDWSFRAMVAADEVEPRLPLDSRGFADFYAGIHHASNVGKMFRPDQPPLLPNYRHVPIAYNGRSSSLVPSGAPIVRPWGQTKTGDDVLFRPTAELDFELEVGWYVGKPNRLGEPIPVEEAEEHLLGLVLLNDWSARDVQRWEYQPLGPFLSKSFATSVSPWIVALDALASCRIDGMPQEPTPLPHLRQPSRAHFDVELEVRVNETVVSRSNLRHLYWSIAQQVAHFTSNGANLENGDLCATGTISGDEPETYGSMLELSWRGTRPVPVGGGQRTFLEDGDLVEFRGKAGTVSFGSLRNRVSPARRSG
jgi:fumarylacetoacetase